MRVRLMTILIMISGALAVVLPAHAGPNDKTGRINNAAATAAGFLFMLDTGVPANCVNAYQGWLLLPEANKALIALGILALQNTKVITVYAAGIDPATGYCKIEAITGIPWTS